MTAMVMIILKKKMFSNISRFYPIKNFWSLCSGYGAMKVSLTSFEGVGPNTKPNYIALLFLYLSATTRLLSLSHYAPQRVKLCNDDAKRTSVLL